MVPSGAAIVESGQGATQGTAQKKEKPGKKAQHNSIEYRLDYIVSILCVLTVLQCNFLGIKKETAGELTTLDFSLDDICRMDFVQHFVNLKELVLNNQGIQTIEVSVHQELTVAGNRPLEEP